MKKATKFSSALLALTLGLTACSGGQDTDKKETTDKKTMQKI